MGQKCEDEVEKKELSDRAAALLLAASSTKVEEVEVCVREWLPYDDYKLPDNVDAIDLSWPVPTVQRLWFG